MSPYLIIGIIIISIVFLTLLISFITYIIAFYGPKKANEKMVNSFIVNKEEINELVERLKKVECEEVTITSYDGLKLFARYYHVKDGAPLSIGFHGYRGSSFRDFSGGAFMVMENGHNLLLVDQRATGKSQGKTITFGIKEKYDCLSWVNYSIERFGKDVQIFLRGISMGSATVLFASGLDLPENVIGISADCPYSSPKAIIKKVVKDMKYPSFAYIFLVIGAKIFGNFNLNKESIVEAVKKAKVPVILLHGEDDGFVPCYMSKEIYDAYNGEKRLFTFPKANHGNSYFVDNERYVKELVAFTNEILDRHKK